MQSGISYASVIECCQIEKTGLKQGLPEDAGTSQHATLPLQGSKNGHEEGKNGAQAEPWTIKIERGNEVEGHVPNSIRTAKYNAITFFPIFLIEMFGRVAYLYFLAQVPSLLEKAHSMMSTSCYVTRIAA